MRSLVLLFVLATPVAAADPAPLTPQQLADGWVKLFDGESTFGWPKEGTDVRGGKLVLSARGDRDFVIPVPATHQGQFDIECVYNRPGWDNEGPRLIVSTAAGGGTASSTTNLSAGRADFRYNLSGGDVRAALHVPRGGLLTVTKFDFRPVGTKPLFNGKTLDGWKVFADPKRARSKFEVTPEGELKVTDGPGDLQSTTTHGDFLLSFDCKTRGKNLNSGVFFRCMPGECQNGYEAQVQNAFVGTDRTKPADFGTGAIYRRVPARKVVSNDNEWFTMTVLAVGPTIRTWVNGEPVVNWTDDRPKDDNPRKGLRTAAGHLSIQGHDPTTDILFKNIKVLDIK